MAENASLNRMAISRKTVASITLPDFPKFDAKIRKSLPHLAAVFDAYEAAMAQWRENAQYVLNQSINALKHAEEESTVTETETVVQTSTVAAGNSVVAETVFGIAPSAGGSSEFARSDHSHGTPPDPIIAHTAHPNPHPQYLTSAEDPIPYALALGGV